MKMTFFAMKNENKGKNVNKIKVITFYIIILKCKNALSQLPFGLLLKLIV